LGIHRRRLGRQNRKILAQARFRRFFVCFNSIVPSAVLDGRERIVEMPATANVHGRRYRFDFIKLRIPPGAGWMSLHLRLKQFAHVEHRAAKICGKVGEIDRA
jgi:hypothetical protein